jgi:hypothetical protein
MATNVRTIEEIFADYSARRDGLVAAVTDGMWPGDRAAPPWPLQKRRLGARARRAASASRRGAFAVRERDESVQS